jgi:arginyl-tRNA--protein-N-Asp/Glu arginylyltransferase
MHYHEMFAPGELPGDLFDALLALGWYPMQQNVFTISHLDIGDGTPPRRVRWLRYRVDRIGERRSHRRIRSRNHEFTTDLIDPFVHSEELRKLYRRYLNSVAFDGYPSIEAATYPEGGSNIYTSKALMVRDGSRLIAAGIFHEGNISLASVLHFFDPDFRRFSLGKHLILKTIEYCRDSGLVWYYPGYVIVGDPRMDYKLFLGKEAAQYYHPIQGPLKGTWLPYSPRLTEH